ncbi:TetR family transcriptional regulator [Mycolicibacterium helvum]|uniref:TetR family transcriptional regulator n=1 Tax=Mycolicibacterium helvum TaxID=1534349 RepID=A0A7I7TDL0_9MYCO|nr:TetR family transcriptional regulator [Mycolicibacterium helvum]
MAEFRSRGRGRPRSQAVDHALVEAALAEFTDHGFREMSMQSIAARAGVSKVSLYRRWPSKIAVTKEILQLMGQATIVADHGSVAADVRHLVREALVPAEAKTAATVLMRTMGEIAGNPELLALYREHLLGPRIQQIRALIERARGRAEIPEGLDTDVIAMTIAGPIFAYQLSVLTETDTDLPENVIDQITRTILSGITA